MEHKSELLMPAGSLEKLKTAVLYGADAIYMGTPDMSLRTKSEFTLEEVIEGIEFAHSYGKRVYLTLNLFTHNKDIEKLPEYVETVRKVKPDGVIIADPAVFQYVKEYAPELELHVSTQANVCSWLSVDFWQKMGASLVVMAREVSFPELAEIREKCPDIKLETFVHGAMCMTYSGRCLLSNFMAERGANQGNCANSCRWKYKLHFRLKDGTLEELKLTEENLKLFEYFLEEGFRPGELMPFEEDNKGSYILNSKDLCLMPKLDKYLRLGIDSLKVEGRGKSVYYVAVVARAYRMAMDAWQKDPENWDPKPYMEELETVASRGFTTAFHTGRLTNYGHNYEHTGQVAEWQFAGIIEEVHDDYFVMLAKNRLEAGDVLEFVPPNSSNVLALRMYEFENADTGFMNEWINPGLKMRVKIPFSLFDQIEDKSILRDNFTSMSVVRKEKALTEAEWARLKLDMSARRLEEGQGREVAYEENRQKLANAVEENLMNRRMKSPRVGKNGCCGRGCNGCMIFWQAPEYAKARELMKAKKQGEMLDRDMREDIDDANANANVA